LCLKPHDESELGRVSIQALFVGLRRSFDGSFIVAEPGISMIGDYKIKACQPGTMNGESSRVYLNASARVHMAHVIILKGCIFAFLAVVIAIRFLPSLSSLFSHGFYAFLSFELMLVLLVLATSIFKLKHGGTV
jgi:hypothetical protein